MNSVEEAEKALLEHKNLVTKKQAQLLELNNQFDEVQKLIRDITEQRENLRRELTNDRWDQRVKEREVESAHRLAEAEIRRAEILLNFEKRSAELDELTADATWRENAYEHQIDGAKRLAISNSGILADKRGLGKTLTSLIWLDMMQAKKTIVFAINDVVPQFEEEIQHWTKRPIISLRGLTPSRRALMLPMLKQLDNFIVTINFEAWRKDKTIVDALIATGIDTVIIDEAHKVKSSKKLTARGVFQICFAPNKCLDCGTIDNFWGPWQKPNKSLHDYIPSEDTKDGREYACTNPECLSVNTISTVQGRLPMTGTPILNKPQELFSLLHLYDPVQFADEEDYLRDYCYHDYDGKWKFREGGAEKLTQGMSEFFVQRNRDDAGIHVPPPKITVYEIDPDPVAYPRQWKAYKDLTDAAAIILANGESYDMLYILEIIMRQRQLMTWPMGIELKIKDPETKEVIDIVRFDVDESQKLDHAYDLIQDLVEEEERFIVFSKFKAPLRELQRRSQRDGFKTTMATGDQTKELRARVRDDFDLKNNKSHWSGAYCTYDAFAAGINLNAARHVILLDDEWNPGMEDQAIGRIDRLNNEDQANVHIFRMKKSVDVWMEELLKIKRDIVDGFETGITKDDLFNVIKGEM